MRKRLMLLAVVLIMSITGCTGDGTPAPDVWSIVVAPSITSVNKATFTEGTGGTFTVIASGNPDPTFSLNGTLPTGVTFNTTSGILAGTPATGTAGTYPLIFTASNGISPNATQNFTLTVNHGNVFSIQYRNKTSSPITIWLTGSKPPCSKAEADLGNCNAGSDPAQYSSEWAAMSAAFERSGTAFYIIRGNGVSEKIAISNKVDLAVEEVLRIVPPNVTVGAYTGPGWYYNNYDTGATETSGTTTWITKTGITMPAPEKVMLYEFNISAPIDGYITYDISAVDGLNANATMTYTGCSPLKQKECRTNISAYDGTNDGCPYIMQFSGQNTCPNPKFYTTIDSILKPLWVVPTADFTTLDVSTTYSTYWDAAGRPSGALMASAAGSSAAEKKAYHIWWATNEVAQGWLTYLQKNTAGTCDAYGWAYDEKRLDLSQCDPNTQTCFDGEGNPQDNQDISALVTCAYQPGTYVIIDILKVMQ
ncbi:MAG: Ig domain-containing protein [Smithellaceae bacterium]|nr:Ig domain-containing protein [Smithellaceae bacterium]